MEILIVVGTLTGRGGIETCIRSLAQEACSNGDLVRVLALCASTADGRWHEGLDYTELEDGSPSLKWQALRGIPAIARACRSRAPDAVVVIYSSTIALVKVALALTGLRRPVVAWLHFSNALKQRTSLLRHAQSHLCISSEIAQATAALPGVRRESVHLVHNGTPMAAVELCERSQQGPLRIAYVGRAMMGGQKRTDDLLRALARVEGDWRLQIAGTGFRRDDDEQLGALAAELGIARRIEWLGWREKPWEALGQVDVLVLCSAYEGFPMVLIEAMAHGIPCISTDCSSGPSEIIRSGKNGWLVPLGNGSALTERLQMVVAQPALLPPRKEVRASVKDFDSRAVFRRIRRAIESTISAHGAGRLRPGH
ncbi:glycosyltransferase [Variovorax saccharolyticus]|uniref:glycosyltransferase n=1 Tax=Variovorax saccharolyticus TaxID=3053516 RepID=UPI002574AFB7|nr:glycosyltransferase [Variovorax sp. J22R187]MDM0022648.1 glycosyltransferase [Variovorax sp. J22R187]